MISAPLTAEISQDQRRFPAVLMAPGRWKSRNSAEKNWSVADNLVAKQQNQPALVSASPPPGLARLSGESVTTGCSKICRRSVALTTRPFPPLPPLAGGRG